jgi:hypothetical protein
LGVDEKTVRNDAAENSAPTAEKAINNNGAKISSAEKSAPTLSGAAAAKAVERVETKKEQKAKGKEECAAAKQSVPPNLPLISERFSLMHADIREAEIAHNSIGGVVGETFVVFGKITGIAKLTQKYRLEIGGRPSVAMPAGAVLREWGRCGDVGVFLWWGGCVYRVDLQASNRLHEIAASFRAR